MSFYTYFFADQQNQENLFFVAFKITNLVLHLAQTQLAA